MSGSGIALNILQKVPSLLSVLGSSMIISSVFRSQRNRENTQQRIVGIMSIIDLMASTTWLTSNLWIPKSYDEMFPATLGNHISCDIQGFILQANTTSILYNGCLSMYYLVVIRLSWKEQKVKRLEKVFHVICFSFGFISASVVAALDLYGPANWNCWIAASPDSNTIVDKERQVLAHRLQLGLFYIPLWCAIILSAICMFIIYLHVRKTEMTSARYSGSELVRTKEVAMQGKLFVGAFVTTWLFPSIVRIIQISGGTPSSVLVVLAGTLVGSQGFFNSIVYFRLRFLKKLRRNPFAKKSRIIKLIIKENLFCCCASRDLDDLSHSDDDCEVRLRSSSDSGNHFSSNDVEQGSFIERRLRSVNGSRKNTQPRFGDKNMDWRALRQSGVNLINTKSIDRRNVISTDSDFSNTDNNNTENKSLAANNEHHVKFADEEEQL